MYERIVEVWVFHLHRELMKFLRWFVKLLLNFFSRHTDEHSKCLVVITQSHLTCNLRCFTREASSVETRHLGGYWRRFFTYSTNFHPRTNSCAVNLLQFVGEPWLEKEMDGNQSMILDSWFKMSLHASEELHWTMKLPRWVDKLLEYAIQMGASSDHHVHQSS